MVPRPLSAHPVVCAEWDIGLPSVQGRIDENYPVEREVIPVYYGVCFHGCNFPVGCTSRKLSEGAKKGYLQRLISNIVARLTYGCGARIQQQCLYPKSADQLRSYDGPYASLRLTVDSLTIIVLSEGCATSIASS